MASPLQLSGTYEQSLGGAEAVWQLPPVGTPAGIFFVAHGCSHSATDFFPHSASCASAILRASSFATISRIFGCALGPATGA